MQHPNAKTAAPTLLERIHRAADPLLLADRHRLERRARDIEQRRRQRRPVDRLLTGLAGEFERARQRWELRQAWQPEIRFPESLPITARRNEIREALQQHPVLIVCGDTGSGKTTQLPKIALEAGQGRKGRIGITQPRRLAAVSMARRVAEELGCAFGHQVGCQVRFENRTRPETIVKFMTDGILLSETLGDRWLWQYDTLIVDEAHERSLNIDFTLGYVQNLLRKRCDLKVIVSSATLDVEAFSSFFGSAPILTVEGRTFPIEDVYLPPLAADEDLARRVARAVRWVNELDSDGDLLVFLPGEREIRDAAAVLRGKQYARTEILPLFARLTLAEQQRVFTVGGRRRIVLATNVAETSLTIPGIRYVIDSGLVRINRYHPRRQIESLQIETVSQASARQRRGRCGRVADGVCLHLYSEELLSESPPFTDPEIRRSSLAGVILQMAVLRLPPIEEFPFLDPPQRALVREGYQTLFEIGALDERRQLTPLGQELARFPVDPQLARMILRARDEHVLSEVLVLVAALSIQDPRERPLDRAEAADRAHAQWADERSDFLAYLRLWNAWKGQRRRLSKTRLRKWCRDNFLSQRRLIEWQNLFGELGDVVRELGWKEHVKEIVKDDCFHDRVHRSVLAGIPMHIGARGETMEYRGTRGRSFFIFPGSGLFKSAPPWVVAFGLVETSKLYARSVGFIETEWVEQVAPHLCSASHANAQWNAEQGHVYAEETIRCGELVVVSGRRVHYGRIDPAAAREVFLRDGLLPGNLRSRGEWLKTYRDLLNAITQLEQKIRRPHGLLNLQAIDKHFRRLLPPEVCSTRSLDQWMMGNYPGQKPTHGDTTPLHPTLPPGGERGSRCDASPLEGEASLEPRPRPRGRGSGVVDRFVPSLEEATVPQAEAVLPADYPDELTVQGHRFALTYRYRPGESDDGLLLKCPERLLPRIPPWAPDWLVPGWLPEKVRSVIRALPKELWTACSPIASTADDFLQTVSDGRIDRAQPLVAALARYLTERLGRPVRTDDFDLGRLPEHLVMKVAVLDGSGEIVRLLRELPAAARYSSELDRTSAWLPREWHRSGLRSWNLPALPDHLVLPSTGATEVRGYPALVDEGSTVGARVFLDASEARENHRAGVLRLFRLECAELLASFEKRLPMPTALQLSLCALPGEGRNALDDFLELVVGEAFLGAMAEAPRTPEDFHRCAVAARTRLGELAAQQGNMLSAILKGRDAVAQTVASLRNSPAVAPNLADVDSQLTFLFRPGFLRDPEMGRRYPRYLQGVSVRLERLRLDPAKDRAKVENVRPYQERLEQAWNRLAGQPASPELLRFSRLVQEYRLNLFAPELGTFEKSSPQRLEAAWAGVGKP